MSEERWYRLSTKEKGIWYKLPEAANYTILGNTKTTHTPSAQVKFHDVNLGDIIKDSSHQFDFVDTNNLP